MFLHALWLIHLGEGYRLAGRLGEAQVLAERALALAREHQERGHQAQPCAAWATSLPIASPRERDQAKAHYRQALSLAEDLGMRPLVAHCHLGLSTLYAELDQRAQARSELSAAIDLCRAMDMTFWLPQAEAALAQLR